MNKKTEPMNLLIFIFIGVEDLEEKHIDRIGHIVQNK